MKKTKVYLKDIIAKYPDKDYQQIYDYIMKLIDNKDIAPIKNAGLNGKKPALPTAFWKYEEETDYTDVYEKLDFKLHPMINTEYYRSHPDYFVRDEFNINLLSDYLKNNADLLNVSESMNERSFEIFRREKFFQKEGGLEFCKRLGIGRDVLNYYETSEPLSYYSYSKNTPQNILIIENKDTFFDIRKYMNNTGNRILGVDFDTLIYGAGKGIYKTFSDYANGAEKYFNNDNNLFYFGDLDYEGIIIYEHLACMQYKNVSGKEIKIRIFTKAYETMLDKAELIGIKNLPDTKINQNTNIGNTFLNYFDMCRRKQILQILESGTYIPQEILNEHDWAI